MSVLSKYEEGNFKDFWEKNPQFLIKKEFKEFKSKKNSSLIMWGLAFLLEKKDNEYADMTLDERISFVEEYIWENNIKLTTIEDIVNEYKKLRYTSVDRQLDELESKLEDRVSFLKDEKYTISTAKILDDLIKNSDVLIDKIITLKKRALEQSSDAGTVQGDRSESFLESGI